jgi:AcrR family transcriptional regulator
MDVKPQARPRGRPRNPDADQQIIAATLRLLAEHGYARCSIEAVADEAGVTRATVYRRYPTKADLITAAVCTMEALPDTLDYSNTEAALRWLFAEFQEGIDRADGVSIVSSLYVHRREYPDMLANFREQVAMPGRDKFLTILRAGVDNGSVRADADLETAVDQLVGAYMSRVFSGMERDEGWGDRVVDQVWLGIRS